MTVTYETRFDNGNVVSLDYPTAQPESVVKQEAWDTAIEHEIAERGRNKIVSVSLLSPAKSLPKKRQPRLKVTKEINDAAKRGKKEPTFNSLQSLLP